MENFKYLDKEIEFYQVTGTVLNNDKYSKTHVSSSGGGGYVSQYGGHVSAPQVTSSTTTHQEIWIKSESGAEESLQLVGFDIPLRPGHKITLISAGNKDSDRCWNTILVNQITKKHWLLKNAADLNGLLEIEQPSIKSVSITISISWLIGWLAYIIGFPGYGMYGVAFIIYRGGLRFYKITVLGKALTLHFENIAQQAYQKLN